MTTHRDHEPNQAPITPPRWSVALFSSRETPDILAAAIKAILRAGNGITMVVDVIVNGNRALAEEIIRQQDAILTDESTGTTLRIWFIALGDKSNAWNQYIYTIWPNSELAFFVDGYVEILPDALAAIDRGIKRSEHYLAATGVPHMGHSATRLREQMLHKGGIHGNLYALKHDTMHAVRESGFKLPLSIYRTDPTLGGALSFNLDPSTNEYDNSRILVEAEASWSYQPLSVLNVSNLGTHIKRVARQAQGILEMRAVHNLFAVRKQPPGSLPATTQDLVEAWLKNASRNEKLIFLKKPLCLYALRKLRQQPRLSDANADAQPELLAEHAAPQP